jgi:adenylate cyclase
LGRAAEPITRSASLYFTYVAAAANMLLVPTAAVLHEAEEALAIAEQSGGNVVVGQGVQYLGVILVRMGEGSRAKGLELLDQCRAMAIEKRYNEAVVPLIDSMAAQEKLRVGDVAGAILLSRPAANEFFRAGDGLWTGYVTNVLVEALLKRGDDADQQDAKIAVDRLAAQAVEPGFVVHAIWLLRARALLSRACGEEVAYLGLRDRYRKMATELNFEGHMAMAESMS